MVNWADASAFLFDLSCVALNAAFVWYLDSSLTDTCETVDAITEALPSSTESDATNTNEQQSPPLLTSDSSFFGAILDNPVSFIRSKLWNFRRNVDAVQTYLRLGSMALFHSQCACLCMLAFKYAALSYIKVPGTSGAYSWWIRSTSASIYACTSFGLLFCFKNGMNHASTTCKQTSLLSSIASACEIGIPFIKAAWFGFGGLGAFGGSSSPASSSSGSPVRRAARGFMDFLSMNAADSDDDDSSSYDDESDDEDDDEPETNDNNDNNNNNTSSGVVQRRRNNIRPNHGAGRTNDEDAATGANNNSNNSDEWTDDDDGEVGEEGNDRRGVQ